MTIIITDHGANPEATSDENTAAIQKVLDNAGSETVLVPSGQTFKIDAGLGLRPKDNAILKIDGTLQAVTQPNQDWNHIVFLGNEVKNVTIQGSGILRGERDTHVGDTSYAGARGYCIEVAEGASDITITGVRCTNSWADGIASGGVEGNPPWGIDQRTPKNLVLDGVTCDYNRRNGFSGMNIDGLHIKNCKFINNGTGPGATEPFNGIDLECGPSWSMVTNALIETSIFQGNGDTNINVGGPSGIYKNIVIASTNVYDWHTQPIAVTGNAGKLGEPWWANMIKQILKGQSWYHFWGFPNQWRLN